MTSMQEYLALPALSQGVLQTLLDECPAAAWWKSYLNPNREPDVSTREQDIGTIAHSALLEGHTEMCHVLLLEDYPNMKGGGIATSLASNKAITEAVESVRASGKIPVLQETLDRVNAMVDSAQSFLGDLKHTEPAVWAAFQPGGGVSELNLLWSDGDIPCKARVDRMNNDRTVIIDAKFSSMSVEPTRWGRTQLVNMGYYFGAGFYRGACKRLYLTVPDYLYLNVCTDPPHLVSLCGLAPAAVELGDAKVKLALDRWRRCVERGKWPGYQTRVAYPDLPAWVIAQFEEQQIASGVFE